MPKRARRLGQVETAILSLYARGMSTRDITEHLAEVYGATVSAATISGSPTWWSRDRRLAVPAGRSGVPDPLHRRDPAEDPRRRVVANKAAHIVIGVDVDGIKQVLGGIQQSEGQSSGRGYSPAAT